MDKGVAREQQRAESRRPRYSGPARAPLLSSGAPTPSHLLRPQPAASKRGGACGSIERERRALHPASRRSDRKRRPRPPDRRGGGGPLAAETPGGFQSRPLSSPPARLPLVSSP